MPASLKLAERPPCKRQDGSSILPAGFARKTRCLDDEERGVPAARQAVALRERVRFPPFLPGDGVAEPPCAPPQRETTPVQLRPPSSAGASPKGRQPVSKTGGMGSSPMAPIGKPPWCSGNMRSRHGRDEGSTPSGGVMKRSARVAQWTERPASNRQCPGSIPGAGDGAGRKRRGGACPTRARGARAARRSHEPEGAGPTPAVPTTHRARGASATHRSDKPGTAGSTPAAPIGGCPRGLAERPPGCEPGGPGSSPGAGASRARGSIGQSGCLRSNRMGVRILPRPPFQFVARHRFFDSCPIKDK